MAGVSVEVIDHVTPMLHKAIQSLADFKRPLEMAGQYMFKETIRQFETEGLRSGKKWDALQASTIRRRKKRSSAILQDTGRLRASVTSRARASIYELGRDYLRIGTNLEYARIHQKGGTIQRVSKPGSTLFGFGKQRGFMSRRNMLRATSGRGRKFTYAKWAGGKAYSITIPPRPFLVVTDENRRYINREIFRRWLMGSFR